MGLGASRAGAQQQVNVSVAAVPNPVPPGSCARIVTDVRDELNRQLTLENGTPLQWSSYDYASTNGLDFEWKNTPTGEPELCAKPGAAAANTQVTATIKGMPYNGGTLVTVAVQPYASPPQTYTPPQTPVPSQPVVAAQPPVAAPAPPQQVAEQPVKSGGGFLKKIGGHLKQRAAEVKAETAQSLTLAATQVVDTAFQSGSKLVSSTAAEASNTARMSIGGVGQKLMLVPQRGGAGADNLAVAIASGRVVLLEMRFAPNSDVLEPSARELVRRVAVELRQAMASTPTAQFVIEAHVDSVPNGQVLSEHRAAAVKSALFNSGVDMRRLIALGYGFSRPPQPGGLAVARVEIARVP
jgi:outer membrane protein OmpA-like peptidoglycan-associated protein